MNKKIKSKESGFTLIEILVAIGLIALLAATVIIAVNPARQFAQGRNSQRISNVNAILNAIGQRIADNKGIFDGDVTDGTNVYHCGKLDGASSTTISWAGAAGTVGDVGCLAPTYISAKLSDPKPASGDYQISKDAATGRITIFAPSAELGETVSVTR